MASRGSADSRGPVSHEPISHQPTSVSPILRTTHSGPLSMLLLCRRQDADLCKSPRQSLKEEAKLLLSQNNGCLSGLPLITVTLDVQTSALLWSLKCKSRASCSHLEVWLHVEQ